MNISCRDGNTFIISQLDPFLIELLRQIPAMTDPKDDKKARERLFSKPMEEPEAAFYEEWKTYVEPGLHQLFRSANQVVNSDLKQFTDPSADTCEIPFAHLDSWLNSLNQARLVIAARHNFSDKELEHPFSMAFESARDLALLQIHFYGFLQESVIEEMN